jgi:DNA repair exonuclease SbcCD ATPase subunit
MEIKTLNCDIQSIDKIFHISDIHIRTLKRHKEYREVFDNLFLHIAQHATDSSICVITGDIVHSKLDMSPELVNMLTKFFNQFHIPTIVILGNHDMNLNNLYRLDAISPILDVLDNDNIHFIKENGLFKLGNIVFNHMAVDIPPEKYIKAEDFDGHYKIALHHGAVHNAKTDIGFEISNEHVTTDLFEGHDLTLLGDIHKPAQFLNEEKTIGYPGSLIQQNHGEALDHGILVWDLPTKQAEFVEIHNSYGYVTFEVDQSNIVKSPHRVPEKPRVRIKFNDTDASDIKRLIATIRKKYNVQDISIQRTTNHLENNQNGSISIGNVRDVEHQNKLITQYIEDNIPTATTEEIDAIRHINRTINSKLPVLESVRNVTWYPVSFEFDNMFSYGENNKVDFSKLSDVIGLFAANASGKSSLLDAITYTIFDKCSKTSKSKEVLNNKKSTFKGIFKFMLNDKLYTIEREGITLKHGHVKVNVNFYNEDENLNGEERSDTNKSIRRYLGTYDDFILTAFSLQADNNNFIEKSQRERKDLLSQFLDTTVFEQLYHLASEEIKETAGKLKEYKKTDFGVIIKDSEDIILKNQDKIIELEKNEIDLQESRNDLQNNIVELIESKQPMSYEGPDITSLQKEENKLISDIETLQLKIDTLEEKIEIIDSDISKTSKFIKKFNSNKINKKIELLYDEQTKLSDIELNLKEVENSINSKQKKIDHLKNHEYDPNCKFCTSNIFVQDATKAKEKIVNDIEQKNNILHLKQVSEQTIKSLLPYEDQYNELETLKQELNEFENNLEKLELQLQIQENDLQTKESELETNSERQELFKRNESAIIFNDSVNEKIKTKKELIQEISDTIKGINNKIKSNYGEIEVAKTKKKTALEQLETYKQLETEYKAYEYYLQSVKRDGVPYELIKLAIPKIENEINNVLNQVVDFNMVLQTDGKNINGYIIYDEENFWPLELTSGMERFISSLAIRVALINVSALPRPNFIAIDEGWGSLDQDHISAVVNLFEYFRTKFDFSIIISHVESMRDMVDNLIEVNKIDKFSQIIHA